MTTRTDKEKERDVSTVVTNFEDHYIRSDSLYASPSGNSGLASIVQVFAEDLKYKYEDHEDKECRWDAEYAFFVLKQCIISRVLIFIIQFVMNVAVTDYPTDAFQGVPISQAELSQVDCWIRTSLGGLTRWDAVTFVLCGQLLYAFLLMFTKSTKLALLACVVFTLNPASIFFSAVYSESVYMLLTFCGMFALYADPSLSFIRYIIAALFFSFAFATRSNGIFNFGYIIFQLMIETVYSMALHKFIWERDYGTVLLKV
ncbi:unnamed protein product [Acanthocheilonema viteae]|uniref:GPI mannosyltransferase 2 n=1 Tax=Acanthocheilonema viteae TaxID=6277 RepID=A0A498S675_ACAVI|nr:unnamed protein product [Acanthocheilonema viteae]